MSGFLPFRYQLSICVKTGNIISSMEAFFYKTAILIFTRTEEQEAFAKTFVQGVGKTANAAIARQLIRHAIATAKKTGLPVFVSTGSDQMGNTFGERFAHAIEGVFAEGYENVVAIGNDCPTLTPGLLLDAARRLQTNPLVLGPAADGGVYLLGVSKNAYDCPAFISLPWQTSRLQTGLSAYSETLSTGISWLVKKSDVDNSFGFFAALGQLGFKHQLRKKLVALLVLFREITFHFSLLFLPSPSCFALALRGPPGC